MLLALALMRASHVADLRGRPEPSLLERATALAGGRRHAKGLPTPRLALAQQRLWAGDLASARELLEAELGAARGWGDEGFIGGVLKLLVDLEWRAGAWVRAEQYLEEHWQLAFDGDNRWHEAVVAFAASDLRSVSRARRRGSTARARDHRRRGGAPLAVARGAGPVGARIPRALFGRAGGCLRCTGVGARSNLEVRRRTRVRAVADSRRRARGSRRRGSARRGGGDTCDVREAGAGARAPVGGAGGLALPRAATARARRVRGGAGRGRAGCPGLPGGRLSARRSASAPRGRRGA